MPTFMLKSIARSKVTQIPIDFRSFITTSESLTERLEVSPRKGFYAQLQERLDQKLETAGKHTNSKQKSGRARRNNTSAVAFNGEAAKSEADKGDDGIPSDN